MIVLVTCIITIGYLFPHDQPNLQTHWPDKQPSGHYITDTCRYQVIVHIFFLLVLPQLSYKGWLYNVEFNQSNPCWLCHFDKRFLLDHEFGKRRDIIIIKDQSALVTDLIG